MLKKHNILLIVVCANLLNGCGTTIFSSRETNPTIQDITVTPNFWPWGSDSSVNTFSTTASRRMVLFNYRYDGKMITTCAEPSPDVGETFATAMSNALKVAASDPNSGINVDVSNAYAKAIATQIVPLIYRTQSLQLYRDATHDQCIDRMNGWYSDKGGNPLGANMVNLTSTSTTATLDTNNYNQMKRYMFDRTIESLKEEIPLMLEAQKAFYSNSKNSGVSLDTIKQIADAVKTPGTTAVPAPAPAN